MNANGGGKGRKAVDQSLVTSAATHIWGEGGGRVSFTDGEPFPKPGRGCGDLRAVVCLLAEREFLAGFDLDEGRARGLASRQARL